MTIDERLEAITMNLELLSRDREEDRKRIETLRAEISAVNATAQATAANVEALTTIARMQSETLAKHDALIGQAAALIAQLARTAESHERRLSRIEEAGRQ